MITPRISVVLAVRNGERHLAQSVRSVLDQRFTDFELIVVDDGSTDATPHILAGLQNADARVAVVRQENRGLAASLNRGIAMARGAYIARQDADDISLADRFDRQAAYLDRNPSIAAVGSSAEVIDRSGAAVGAISALRGPDAVRRGLLTLRSTPVHGSMLMRASVVREAGGYREAFPVCQDYDLWLRLSQRFAIDNIAEVLYQWRLDAESVYSARRATQLKYAAIALSFARERAAGGGDSYDALARHAGDLDGFVSQYRLGPFVHATWGELLLRGLGNSPRVRHYLRRAVLGGWIRPRTLALCGWTHLGLPWPGGRPLAVAGAGSEGMTTG
jgi:glycosyltransferase involved in cell wall biosynthesis